MLFLHDVHQRQQKFTNRDHAQRSNLVLPSHPQQTDSLGDVEGESEVGAASLRVQFGVVEGARVEAVDERAERHAVVPAAREVLDVHVLRVNITS